MKRFNWHPVTRKRIDRFRRFRRAYISLWILASLYGLSLFSEVLCNNRPLLLRYEGRLYFPIFRFYPESEFLPEGRQTRPDYKALQQKPVFAAQKDNWMVFPPVPNGPREVLMAEDIRLPDRVEVAIRPVPQVAALYIDEQRRIVRAMGMDMLAAGVDAESGQLLADVLPRLAREVDTALGERFANRPAKSLQLAVPAGNREISVYLSAYEPRSRSPRRIRLRLEFEERDDALAGRVVFEQAQENSGRMLDANPQPGRVQVVRGKDFWEGLPAPAQQQITADVRERFQMYIPDRDLEISGRLCRIAYQRPEVRFPMRPVAGHPLGIDSAGRDVLARLIYGLRVALSFGLALAAVTTLVGILIGAVQGYFAGWVDITGQRLIEIWQALPFLYVLILLGSVFGRSFGLLLIAYGIFNWVGMSHYMRAEFLRLRDWSYVEAARCMGSSNFRIMFRHILPNAMTPVITFFPFSLIGAVGMLTALDYLGFGLPTPTPSWGELLAQGQEFIWAWWLILYPSLILFIVILLTVFIGEGVRAAFDPRKYARWE